MSKQPTMAHEQRVVRVFVSSTFRDMHAERDELIKRTFPQLRKLCEKRGVTFSGVDLRWGVTEEQSRRGEVLPICLAEIQRCRPYFIGLLGERYGWVPDAIPRELIEREPWLKEHLHQSVTELEILHGVLNDPTMADRALFYFRDRAFIDSLPPDEQTSYLELPTKEEIQRFGQQEAERRTHERRQKLAALKARIRTSGRPVPQNYPKPQALGERVLGDLTEIIERLYPIDEVPDLLDREALDHDGFAESRAKVYIGRQAHFDRLDQHARSDGLPLVVLGESGSGKSALLSNWALRYRTEHPDELLLMHFIAATPYSADWAAMLRRVMGEFKRCFDIQQEIPDRPDELRAAFANWLHMAAANGKVVLILDALNQLEDRDGAPDLVWLPPEIPSNIRLIVSTLPGRPLDELNKRGWPELRIRPLEAHEREQLIADYLAQDTKALSPAHVGRITSTEQTANPLYLRSLLDELRVYGDHSTLDQRIEHYLSAATIAELFEKILTRYEEDYERESAGLVRDTMSLLWAARRGLSEAELMDLLGTQHGPLPRAHWSPLYLAAEQSLVSRSGLIGFGHDYLRQAVQDKYLPSKEHQEETHLRLADYFKDQDLGPRKVDELPWQLAEANSWQQLCDLLTEREFFAAAWKASQFEVKAYWANIETSSPLRIVDAYQPVLDAPAQYIAHVWRIGMLLGDTGHPEEALSLLGQLVDHFRQTGDHANLQTCLGNQAWILYTRGQFDEAMRLRKEQERISRELGNKDGVHESLGNQALILYDRGELDEAMRLQKERERICRELGNRDGLQESLGNQALILYDRGELDEAMRLHKEKERICREMGNKDGLQESLGNQALILQDRGELDGAMLLHKQEERICREMGNRDGLQASLGNQALILYARGELDEAMLLFKEQERASREMGNKDGLQRSLGNQALVLHDRGELEDAMRLHKEEERICRDMGNKEGLQSSLGNQALILHDRGELDEAMLLHKEEERVCRELGNKDGLARSLANQALILHDRGELDEAMLLHKEAERIWRELGSKDGLQTSLGNQALIFYARGEVDLAMRLHKEEERICRELGNKDGLQRSFGNQAEILQARGDLDGAMLLHKEEERICRELGSKDGLQSSLGNQALIFYARGEVDLAMRLHKEEERICRELGNKDGVQESLGNQALILADRGDLDEAMRLHKEKERICRELGNKDGLQESLGNQALILADRGELDEAMRLHKEKERICRELGNKKGLARSLINQAQLLAEQMGKPDSASPLADEAYRIATVHGLIPLAQQIKPILDALHSRALNDTRAEG